LVLSAKAAVVTWSFATIVLVPRGEWGPFPDRRERCGWFQWAASAGFDAIELSPRWLDFRQFSAAQLKQIRQEIVDVGLVVSGINLNRCILTRSDSSAANRQLLRQAIHAAATLEAPLVNISLAMPTPPTKSRPVLRGCDVAEVEYQQTARLLRELAAAARAFNVSLSLELHDDGLFDTPELCLKMLDWIDMPNVGVNPDLGNICRGDSGAPWEETLTFLAPHANCWHVKNYATGSPAALWAGDIDYARAMSIMHAADYSGPVSIESYFDDVLDQQIQGLAYLKKLSPAKIATACEARSGEG
jgi:sugar phosphate isomerase/epimerase